MGDTDGNAVAGRQRDTESRDPVPGQFKCDGDSFIICLITNTRKVDLGLRLFVAIK